MGRLQPLKHSVKMLQSSARTLKAGDSRIRGSALQAIRHRILTRDKGICKCEECKATGRVMLATVVDHITPLWAGGHESDANRQALSVECHDRKSADEAKVRAGGRAPSW